MKLLVSHKKQKQNISCDPLDLQLEQLLRQRSDLTAFIRTIECDTSVNPESWQHSSLKKRLGEIDQRIVCPHSHVRGRDRGHN